MKHTPLVFLCAAVLSALPSFAQTGVTDQPTHQPQKQTPGPNKPAKSPPPVTPNPKRSKPLASPTPPTNPETPVVKRRIRKPAATPPSASARFRKSVMDAISVRWYSDVKPQQASLTPGVAKVEFVLDEQGRATDVKLVSNTSDEAFGKICIQAVENTELPPLPPEVLASAKGKPMEYSVTFNLYQE